MITTLSSKGQIVLPRIARSRFGLQAGAKLICEIQDDAIILKPEKPSVPKREYVTDKISKLRVVKKTKNSPLITTDMVKTILTDFP